MQPFEFLIEEHENVARALEQTLRYDYAPELSAEFYGECAFRLDHIKQEIDAAAASGHDPNAVAALLGDLGDLATAVSLIERSHLGEFSWPFADELRKLANPLLAEPGLVDPSSEPIIHVVADGRGYRIRHESLVPASSRRQFIIVLFPRPHKDHVLLHSIFGHELGHTALRTIHIGAVIRQDSRAALSTNVMAGEESVDQWLNSPTAPEKLKVDLKAFAERNKAPYKFNETIRQWWLDELICDLCGLLLFGPAFLAAHTALIGSTHSSPLEIDLLQPTHPPYAIRHRMLVQAMRTLQWHKTVTIKADGDVHEAESTFLKNITHDTFPSWAQLFAEAEVEAAIRVLQSVLPNQFVSPTRSDLVTLVERLKNALPPLVEHLGSDEILTPIKTNFRHILHAGWLFWEGKTELAPPSQLTFLQTNQLCNQALLQQRAINEFLGP